MIIPDDIGDPQYEEDRLVYCKFCGREYFDTPDHDSTFEHRLAEYQHRLKAEGWARVSRLHVPLLHAAFFPVQVLSLEESDPLFTTVHRLDGETPNTCQYWTRKWVRDLTRDTWADLKSLPLPHRRGQLLGAMKIWRDNHRDPVLDQWEFRIEKIHSPKPKV